MRGAEHGVRAAAGRDPSRFTAVTLPLEVHSGFSADAAFRFGLELGHSSSPGEACYSGSGFGGCSGSAQGVPSYTPPRQVALRGSAQALLESTFDL